MSDSRFRAVKAYKNAGFLGSPQARPLRILSEYLEPQRRFEELRIKDTIVIFGSARIKSRETALEMLEKARKENGDVAKAERELEMSKYYEASRELAKRLTTWSKSLEGTDRRFVICSGGGPGIMEAANRGASEAKGENIGLGISLPFEQTDNPYITRRLAFEFHYFFMRKFWFSYMAKAFIVMPGGFGTLDELFEILTLIQTFKIKKKIALVLFGKEFWSQVMHFQPMVDFGTISPNDPDLCFATDSIDDAYEHVTSFLEQHCLELEPDGGRPTL
ncbi:MAG: LOG family protein [Planctomycetota bacterium]